MIKKVILLLSIATLLSAQTVLNMALSPAEYPNGDPLLTKAFNERIANLWSVEPSAKIVNSSLATCGDFNCQMETAKKAGAEMILHVAISGFGSLHSITGRLISLETGTVVVSVNEDFKGTSEEFLLAVPSKIVQQIVAKYSGTKQITISVSSEPAGAEVFLGTAKVGVTPFVGTIKEPGSYAIRLSKSGFTDILDTVKFERGTAFSKSFTLSHSQAWLDSVTVARKDSIFQAANKSMRSTLPEALTQLTMPLAGREGIRIAVIPFESADSLVDARKMSGEYAVNYLVSQPGITVVDRENFKKVYEELQLSQSNLISEKSALEMGKMLSANYILTGSVSSFSKKQTVFMRLINTETAQIVTASTAQLNQEMTDQLIADIFGEKLNPASAGFRSLVVPGWGQIYTGHKGHAFVSMGLVAAAIGATTYFAYNYNSLNQELDKFIGLDPSMVLETDTPSSWAVRAESKEAEVEDARMLLNYALIGTGSLWIGNVIDAFILGSVESKKTKSLYFSALPLPTKSSMTIAAGFSVRF